MTETISDTNKLQDCFWVGFLYAEIMGMLVLSTNVDFFNPVFSIPSWLIGVPHTLAQIIAIPFFIIGFLVVIR